MKTVLHIALALAVCSSAALAETPQPATSIVIDCAHFALPTQRQVGELLGQHNASQVYASRTRLMANARRDCKGGFAQVILVVEPAQDARRKRLAQQSPRR
ncbi:MAG: hypothetical protein LH470_10030 [Lysobacter sp.]|nr:hypothetical protein [Lysobacter sp.]